MKHWETVSIHNISAQEFHRLIERNREHIARTFPRTLEGCKDAAAVTAFINTARQKQQEGENYYFYLRDAIKGNLTGYIVVKNIEHHVLKCELAYFIDKNYQGQGIMTQTVAHVVDFCFNTLKMNKVYICTSLTNHASQKVALKNGFVQEGILKEEFKNSEGVLEDVMYFGLIKSEYGK
ncbi:GCN5 family acetyltransferase [Flavobacterium akiainvivens]|uniref:GCN5 family acetyltransferase n=1 Tax=Flavobacterium akiainvivens TaxID=1202724 RepID=A0A0M8MEG2_9FLAO|nr:GNAT family protein [Flavobacterium akiainvivens]KOS07164.1 GCN5 family acetyltransferase [Flavobacterium akiainvivens]SFQ73054.1 ribosomal-protein-alanine N-acetyltransferase [Flavobacterium akiainvivens]